MIRVLHVDDDESVVDLTKLNIERLAELQLEHAGSASEALKKIEEKEYDCILSDYQMPVMDGLQLL